MRHRSPFGMIRGRFSDGFIKWLQEKGIIGDPDPMDEKLLIDQVTIEPYRMPKTKILFMNVTEEIREKD